MPKACKTLKNEGEKNRDLLQESLLSILLQNNLLSQLPLKSHKSHKNKLWNHAKKMIILALLCRQRYDKP